MNAADTKAEDIRMNGDGENGKNETPKCESRRRKMTGQGEEICQTIQLNNEIEKRGTREDDRIMQMMRCIFYVVSK